MTDRAPIWAFGAKNLLVLIQEFLRKDNLSAGGWLHFRSRPHFCHLGLQVFHHREVLQETASAKKGSK